jgi:arylsulfatase A-like enzyme
MSRPNIVFILADDLGWRDLGCQGSSFYESPVIDRLCGEGMRFTNAYAACPVCSPTRASILTGKYPARLRLTNYIDWKKQTHPLKGRVIDAPYIDHLPLTEASLARALGGHGYATWHVGKWHLGYADTYPERHGFETNVGGCEWGMPINGYFAPWGIPNLPGDDIPAGKHLDDHLTDCAVDLIRGAARNRPFFLNLWYYGVHTPLQALPEEIARFARKATEMGLERDEDAFEARDRYPYEQRCSERVRHRVVQSNPVFAAMIRNLDRNVGRVLSALEEAGLASDTLVVFHSDNGGLSSGRMPPTCHAPLASGKGWMREGGVRVPLIVRWPGTVRPGTVGSEPVTSPDFYPTLLEAAGLPPAPGQHVDGRSFLAALRGEPFERGPIFWHYPHYSNCGGRPGCAVRLGSHSLVRDFDSGRTDLFDLERDIGQARDLTGELPESSSELEALLDAWLADVGALFPAPNPDWPPRGQAPGCGPEV